MAAIAAMASVAGCGSGSRTASSATGTSAIPITATTSTSVPGMTTTTPSPSTDHTVQLTYQPFTPGGAIAPGLRVTKRVSGTCNGPGVAGNSSYRCFAQNSIYDPCFARSGATIGPLVCPTNPADPDVVEFDTAALPGPSTGAPEQRAWAIQMDDGQVCVQINAAWGGLGPFACQAPGPRADCHVPVPSSPWWTAECQSHLTDTSQFRGYRVRAVWF